MAAEGLLSAAERQRVIDQRLDELDRSLLGLLPRTERLAIVTDVEARVKALGDNVPLTRETAADLSVVVPATNLTRISVRSGARRSRTALSAGVLGIVSAACLLVSPLLFIAASVCAEILGEEITIALMGLFVFVLVVGGGLAVFLGGASILRLTRRGQTTTGTGWAITGLCTGMLPMLIGGVGLLSVGVQIIPSEAIAVSAGPVYYQTSTQPVQYSQDAPVPSGPAMLPPGPPMYGPPVEWNAKAPPGMPMPMLPSAPLPPALPAPLIKPQPASPPPALTPPMAKPPAAKEPASEVKKESTPQLEPLPADLPEEEEKLGIDFEE